MSITKVIIQFFVDKFFTYLVSPATLFYLVSSNLGIRKSMLPSSETVDVSQEGGQ